MKKFIGGSFLLLVVLLTGALWLKNQRDKKQPLHAPAPTFLSRAPDPASPLPSIHSTQSVRPTVVQPTVTNSAAPPASVALEKTDQPVGKSFKPLPDAHKGIIRTNRAPIKTLSTNTKREKKSSPPNATSSSAVSGTPTTPPIQEPVADPPEVQSPTYSPEQIIRYNADCRGSNLHEIMCRLKCTSSKLARVFCNRDYGERF